MSRVWGIPRRYNCWNPRGVSCFVNVALLHRCQSGLFPPEPYCLHTNMCSVTSQVNAVIIPTSSAFDFTDLDWQLHWLAKLSHMNMINRNYLILIILRMQPQAWLPVCVCAFMWYKKLFIQTVVLALRQAQNRVTFTCVHVFCDCALKGRWEISDIKVRFFPISCSIPTEQTLQFAQRERERATAACAADLF